VSPCLTRSFKEGKERGEVIGRGANAPLEYPTGCSRVGIDNIGGWMLRENPKIKRPERINRPGLIF
jgi:hypothetical protein